MKSSKLKTGSSVYVTSKGGTRMKGQIIDRWMDHLSVIFDNGRFGNIHCRRVNFAKINGSIVEINFHSRIKRKLSF